MTLQSFHNQSNVLLPFRYCTYFLSHFGDRVIQTCIIIKPVPNVPPNEFIPQGVNLLTVENVLEWNLNKNRFHNVVQVLLEHLVDEAF